MGFAAESEDFYIHGTAYVDFSNEMIHVVTNSEPKKALGVGLHRLFKLIKIDGQLTSPQVSFSEAGVLRLGAEIAAGVFSDGLSILAEGLFKLLNTKSNVCGRALGQ